MVTNWIKLLKIIIKECLTFYTIYTNILQYIPYGQTLVRYLLQASWPVEKKIHSKSQQILKLFKIKNIWKSYIINIV